MKRVMQILAMLMLVILPVLPVQSARLTESSVQTAIETTCPDIVQRAWENVDSLCENLGRNEACYGHVLLEAQPQPGVMQFAFDNEGEMVEVVKLQSLRLSRMDLLEGTWGVALMQIQANLPAVASNEHVSLLLFGDVEIENAIANRQLVNVTPRSPLNTINVRYQPSTRSGIIGVVEPDDVVVADGRLAGGAWLHVQLPESETTGWVFGPLFESVGEEDIESLHEVSARAASYGPMQAFYFQSGGRDAMCPEAPNSGILIQTPEGVAEVTLLINEVDIQLGSTVYFQADLGNQMTVSVVEGHATVTAGGQTQTAFAGTQIGVPLDENGLSSGPPTPPQPYDLLNLNGLPVEHLDMPVVIGPPLTEDEIAALQDATTVSDFEPADDPNNDNSGHPNPSEGAPPPGLVDNPALGDDGPPGQSESSEPPGQAKKDK